MRCTHCGSENPDGATLCGGCSVSLNRCASCGFANPSGFRFCGACGAAFAAGARAPAHRDYTPRHLADKILASRAALEGERKQVTVLFADVKGSLALAGSGDAEEWHVILDRYFAILTAGVHRFEGTVNQYTGDGIMALFGAPIAHEDHAQRACFAALSMREELTRYSAELRQSRGLSLSVRMGLNSGEVVVGKIGDDLRMDYTAQGETVGLAARMEQLAEPGTIYLAPQTAALVAGLFELKDHRRFFVKGARGPIRVHELLGEGSIQTRLDVSRKRGFTPFVGRGDLLADLEKALSDADGGVGQTIELVGEAGIGKSRLCYELAERCRARGVCVLEARPRAGNIGGPFHPVLDLLRAALELPRDIEPAAIPKQLAAKLALPPEPVTDSLPLLCELLGASDPEQPAPRMEPEARRRNLSRVLAAVLHRRSAGGPVLVVAEDIHAFDVPSRRVLDSLGHQLRNMRVLLLLSRRSDGAATRIRDAREISLGPLDAAATRELVRGLLGEHHSVATLVDEIADVSNGNPFFIEEVVRTLVSTRRLKGRDGDYRAVQRIDRPSLPATVQALLDARIDSLPEREKTLLQAAAVVGREFNVDLLRKALGGRKADLTRLLKRLSVADFVEPVVAKGETVYAFRQTLMHEVAYRSQLSPQRQRLHARLAEILLASDSNVDSRAGQIAAHWEAAGRPEQAVEWYARAAHWSGPNDPAEAYRQWEQVSHLVGETPQSQEALLLAWRAQTQRVNLGWRLGVPEKRIAEDFAAALRFARQSASPEAVAATYGAFGIARGMAGHIREANDDLTRATEVLDDTTSPGLRVALYLALSHAQGASGRLAEALETAERALAWTESDATLGRDRAGMSPGPLLAGFRASVLTQMGRLEEAREGLDQALALARKLDEVEVQGFILAWRVSLATVTGEGATVLDDARLALQAAEQTGSTFARVTALASVARAHALRFEWAEAVAAATEAIDLARERRAGLALEAALLCVLAEAHFGRDDHRLAISTAKQAVSLARHRGTRVDECAALLTLARVSKASRRQQGITKLLDQASRLVEETGAKAFEPFILAVRAAVAERGPSSP
jgi:class 3 adenylate cyclase/tetratricopeptide (TPR) repeat protein